MCQFSMKELNHSVGDDIKQNIPRKVNSKALHRGMEKNRGNECKVLHTDILFIQNENKTS